MTRLGDVYRALRSGLPRRQIAQDLGVRTDGFVSNYNAMIAALLDGLLPNSPSMGRQVRSALASLRRGTTVELSPAASAVFAERVAALEAAFPRPASGQGRARRRSGQMVPLADPLPDVSDLPPIDWNLISRATRWNPSDWVLIAKAIPLDRLPDIEAHAELRLSARQAGHHIEMQFRPLESLDSGIELGDAWLRQVPAKADFHAPGARQFRTLSTTSGQKALLQQIAERRNESVTSVLTEILRHYVEHGSTFRSSKPDVTFNFAVDIHLWEEATARARLHEASLSEVMRHEIDRLIDDELA